MKTILFFDRCELTDFYAQISERIDDEFKVIHVAYSIIEANLLKSKYNITPNFIYQDLVNQELNVKTIDVNLLREIDALIIDKSEGRFSLNSSIQSDRGFALLRYEEALLLAQSQYNAWCKIFDTFEVDFFYHEPPSLFMNHIASFICLSRNAKYCFDSMLKGEEKYNYIFLMQDTAYSPEINKAMDTITVEEVNTNKERIEKFLNEFRESYDVFFGEVIKSNVNYFTILMRALKTHLIYLLNQKKIDKLKSNVDYWLLQNNDNWNKFKNLINYKLEIKFDELNTECDYYYYSMNLEPEATVLYLGDGLYENQIKLISNIAAQLPPNTYLYVKDHPHFNGYRNYQDYKKLMNIPNIKVLKPEIPGKLIIKHCIGVFMVNGTAGFEGILLNKHVYTFGNMFFNISHRVNYVKNIKDLREIVYRNHEVILKDDFQLFKFIYAYLNSIHRGVTDYFQGRIDGYDIDQNKNIDIISADLKQFFRSF